MTKRQNALLARNAECVGNLQKFIRGRIGKKIMPPGPDSQRKGNDMGKPEDLVDALAELLDPTSSMYDRRDAFVAAHKMVHEIEAEVVVDPVCSVDGCRHDGAYVCGDCHRRLCEGHALTWRGHTACVACYAVLKGSDHEDDQG